MISYADKLVMFDKGEVRSKHRREPSDKLEWFRVIGNSIYAGFAEFIIATRFAFASLDEVYEAWDQQAAAIANDTKTTGELFEIYCYSGCKRNYIQTRWLNEEFMPKFRPSKGDYMGLDDIYRTQYKLFSDLMQTSIKLGNHERVIESLNKFNAKFQRVESGFVSTPTHVAQRMIDMLDLRPNDVVIDPTCGRGIFPALLRKKFGGDLRVYGIEKDVGKAYLAAAFYDPTHFAVSNIYCRDSLSIKSYDKEILKVSKNAVALANLIEGGNKLPGRVIFVGNPPYQEEQGKSSAKAIYHRFVDHALGSGNEVLFVIPARWYASGKGLDTFRSEMLSSRKIKRLVDFPLSETVFPHVDIESGVCFLHAVVGHNAPCEFTDAKGQRHTLDVGEFDIFVRQPEAASIIRKVVASHDCFMSQYVGSQTPFGLLTSFRSFGEKTPETVTCRTKEGFREVERKHITRGQSLVGRWKVIASEAFGLGDRPDPQGRRKVMGIVDVLPPDHVCLQTYIILSSFDTEIEARNCVDYFRLKFPRFLLGARKISQHISPKTFSWVPKVDFTQSWTDQELYDSFGLTEAERAHIEATIR